MPDHTWTVRYLITKYGPAQSVLRTHLWPPDLTTRTELERRFGTASDTPHSRHEVILTSSDTNFTKITNTKMHLDLLHAGLHRRDHIHYYFTANYDGTDNHARWIFKARHQAILLQQQHPHLRIYCGASIYNHTNTSARLPPPFNLRHPGTCNGPPKAPDTTIL